MHRIGNKLMISAAEADRVQHYVRIDNGVFHAWLAIGETILGLLRGSGTPESLAVLTYHHGVQEYRNGPHVHIRDEARSGTRTIFLEPGSLFEEVVGPRPKCTCGKCP